MILPVVMYASRKLKEEHRQKVFENKILRQIFGPERDVNEEGTISQ